MKERLAMIIEDVKAGRNIESYLLILMAMVIGTINLISPTEQALMDTIVLGLLSALVYSMIRFDRAIYRTQTATDIQGIIGFYIDRSTLPSFENLLADDADRIAILGVQLGSISHSFLPLLEAKASRGCHVRLLLMSPIDQTGLPVPWLHEVGRLHTYPGLSSTLQGNLRHLKLWLEQLPDTASPNVEVKLYASIPTLFSDHGQ